MQRRIFVFPLLLALLALAGSATSQNSFADELADSLNAVVLECSEQAQASLARLDADDLLFTYDRLACFEIDGDARLVRSLIDYEAGELGGETVGAWQRLSDGSLQRDFYYRGSDFMVLLVPADQGYTQYSEIARVTPAQQEGVPRADDVARLYEGAFGGHPGDCFREGADQACTFIPGNIDHVLARVEGEPAPPGVTYIYADSIWRGGPSGSGSTMYSALVEFESSAYILTLIGDALFEGEVYLDVGVYNP